MEKTCLSCKHYIDHKTKGTSTCPTCTPNLFENWTCANTTVTYDPPKLVRDFIPELIMGEAKGIKVKRVFGKEYGEALNAKLREEVEELIENPCLNELADVQEVLTAIRKYHGFRASEVTEAFYDKRRKRGALAKGYMLMEVKEMDGEE